jgi:hypothetical protein
MSAVIEASGLHGDSRTAARNGKPSERWKIAESLLAQWTEQGRPSVLTSKKLRNPDLTPEQIALIESDDPGCGKEFTPRLCIMRRRAAKNKEAKGLEYGPCAYCPAILKFLSVTKSAYKPQEEPMPEIKNPAPVTGVCKEAGCENPITKHSTTGRCKSCACSINAKLRGKKKPAKAPVDVPGVGTCPEPAADTIHARPPKYTFFASAPSPDIYRRALQRYGDRSQILKTAEEASELSAAIMRYMGTSDIGLTSPLRAMVEELADVEIMCRQMRLIFGDQPVDAAVKMKLERLEGRLRE